ncbi:MAG: UvrD-helicase domain-containing protein, partial [Rubripirellula sp.]
PKQSIYRFRRGDIVTYNRVREVFERTDAELVSLSRNFRSTDELIDFNNRIFSEKFLPVADSYAPAVENMLVGREESTEGILTGVRKLTVDPNLNINEATTAEAESIARFIRHALDSRSSVPRTKKESGFTKHVVPRDFLIIPRGKNRIHLFKQALDHYDIPCEVTGGNAFSDIAELDVLMHCLRTIDDPHHAVNYLAILRDRLFGFSDQDLYVFRKSGGRFCYTTPLPNTLDDSLRARFENVNLSLRRYQVWLRTFPFSTALLRIAGDLGLLAMSASSREGNIEVGGFLKAMELVRQQSYEFDSVTDLISYLERIVSVGESEGCSALPPEANVVRVMNLHKAKGLEAPIVFLADTSTPYSGQPLCHIDRSETKSRGYMGITEKRGQWKRTEVATPANWSHHQAEESRFLTAERDRLLYVATTRAAAMTIISVGKDKSAWADLHPYLHDTPELELPERVGSRHENPTQETASSRAVSHSEQKWNSSVTPSYQITSAKNDALKGSTRPNWNASGNYGMQWGSALHELLETACRVPNADLGRSAHELAQRYEIEQSRLEELESTVRAVMHSEIWQRAQQSARCFSELPFETCIKSERDLPKIVRGVIDLVFEQPGDGWVIVDYKSDDITAEQLPNATQYYLPQLQEYAAHWTEITGDPVVELGLYFTRIDQYSSQLT